MMSSGAAAVPGQPLSTALESAPQTAQDPSAPAVFKLTPLLPPPRGSSVDSRPYISYDGVGRSPDWLWDLGLGATCHVGLGPFDA